MGRRLSVIAVMLGLTALTLTDLTGAASARAPLPASVSVGTNLSAGRRISCSEGARMLRARGFSNIRMIDCRGTRFVYHADRRGHRLRIEVNARNGRVTHVDRVRPVRGRR